MRKVSSATGSLNRQHSLNAGLAAGRSLPIISITAYRKKRHYRYCRQAQRCNALVQERYTADPANSASQTTVWSLHLHGWRCSMRTAGPRHDSDSVAQYTLLLNTAQMPLATANALHRQPRIPPVQARRHLKWKRQQHFFLLHQEFDVE